VGIDITPQNICDYTVDIIQMQHYSTRLKFIATIGAAGTIAVAGCSALPGNPKIPPDGNSSPTPTSPTQGGGTTTPGTGTDTQTDTQPGNNPSSNQPFTRGKKVDDFEGNVGSRWQVDYGKYTVTNEDAYEGNQSLVLEPRNPSKRKESITRPYARVSRFFTGSNKALDLSNHDLTMAVKVDKPKDQVLDITANIHAPTGSLSLTSTRQIPKAMDDWVRYDLGYTGTDGKPKLENVLQVEITITTIPQQAKDFRVKIDGLRKIPKPKKGKVIFQFDDGHITAYENAYPVLQQKGWPAGCAVVPDAIGGDKRVSLKMMSEMQQNGWDMMSHPKASPSTALPGLPEQVQRRKIVSAHQKLAALGFEKGARHFVAPYNRVSGTTLDIISDVHETGFLFGACPNNARHPSNPYFISRVQGGSVRGAKDIIDMAARFNQLAVVTYHVIGGNGTPMSVFKRIVDYVEKQNVDVISPSQLIDGK
jgi:peptidoglycan/xylan/chitin deacetylase (PgdA/CDA1 family)